MRPTINLFTVTHALLYKLCSSYELCWQRFSKIFHLLWDKEVIMFPSFNHPFFQIFPILLYSSFVQYIKCLTCSPKPTKQSRRSQSQGSWKFEHLKTFYFCYNLIIFGFFFLKISFRSPLKKSWNAYFFKKKIKLLLENELLKYV